MNTESNQNTSLIGVQLNHYRIERFIASGGMADVYQATDLTTGESVALKILPPEYARNREMVERFHHEARSAGTLKHPNIVRIFEEGEANNLHYIAMELVAGRTLKEILKEHGALLPPRVLKITAQICHALNYAHARGIVHRDIKPANIMVDADDNVIITDFGIAKAADSTQLTSTGTAMGTPEYMSPEQIRGEADYRTDIYSLGVVMYEMLTGRVPFQADTPISVAYKHTHERPVPPSRIAPHTPRELETIILKALEKDPDKRYQSVQELYNELPRQIRATVPPTRVPTGSVSVPREVEETPVQSPVKFIAVLVLITLVGLGIAAYFTLLTGFLSVDSTPSGASVWIDGKRAGETPLRKRVLVGTHRIEIRKNGYGLFTEKNVSVVRSATRNVRAKLPHQISSSPSGAEVYVNGTLIGKTPVTYDFKPGTYTLVLKKEGYEDLTKQLRASSEIMQPLPTFYLARIPERYAVEITSKPSGARVAIDGRYRGDTPLKFQFVRGQHHIYIVRPGYRPSEGFLRVPGQERYHVTLKPLRAYGKLSVNAVPFATVYLDGKLKGETPLILQRVSAGDHQVRLERTGYHPITVTVTVEPDQTARVAVRAQQWVKAP